jgi:hypothetical protein
MVKHVLLKLKHKRVFNRFTFETMHDYHDVWLACMVKHGENQCFNHLVKGRVSYRVWVSNLLLLIQIYGLVAWMVCLCSW